MIEKWKVTVPILTGNEERNAYIYLPESYYNGNEDTRYPVLYMFDGHNVFFDSFNKFDEIFVSSQTIHSSFPVSTESVKTL